MERLKLMNWKFVIYWFVVMMITNVYLIPKYVDHQQITSKRIIVGGIVSLLSGLIMGLITAPKTKEKEK